MNFDVRHNLEDLRQTYPNAPRELLCGDGLVHHAYAFGRPVVCIEAVRECLAIARQRADTGAVAHLGKHIKDYAAWREQQQALDFKEKGRNARDVVPVSTRAKGK